MTFWSIWIYTEHLAVADHRGLCDKRKNLRIISNGQKDGLTSKDRYKWFRIKGLPE